MNYFYYYGNTDTIAHVSFVKQIIQQGTTGAIPGIYSSFPLWHIFVALTQILTDLPVEPRFTMFLLSAFVSTLFLAFVFNLTRLLSETRNALLAVLFVVGNGAYLYFTTYSIPRMTSSLLLFIALYITFFSSSEERADVVLLVILGPLVLYHPVTFTYAILIYAGIASAQIVHSGASTSRPYSWVIATVFAIGYWIFESIELVKILSFRIVSSPSQYAIRSISYDNAVIIVIERLKYLILFSLLLYGAIHILRADRNNELKVVVLTGLIGSFFAFPGPFALIGKFVEELGISRWSIYMFPFISIGVATGFTVSVNNRSDVAKLVMVALVFCATILMVGTGHPAMDNQLLPGNSDKGYFTESEIHAIHEFTEATPELVQTDHITRKYIAHSEHRGKGKVLNLDDSSPRGSVLIRQSSFEGSQLLFRRENILVVIRDDDKFTGEVQSRHKIFDSENYKGYR